MKTKTISSSKAIQQAVTAIQTENSSNDLLRKENEQLRAEVEALQKRVKPKKKGQVTEGYDPYDFIKNFAISGYKFILIHPNSLGHFEFAMFWRDEEIDPYEIVGGSFGSFETKELCISAAKKLIDGYVDTFYKMMSSGFPAYDHLGRKIDMKIRTRKIF